MYYMLYMGKYSKTFTMKNYENGKRFSLESLKKLYIMKLYLKTR